ncbi:MAG: 50S ribosomal protein L5 [Patescibacteria group bacterium]
MQNKQRLRQKYEKEVARALREEFSIKNPMAVPRVTKVVINMGVGELAKNKELAQALGRDLAAISGQKPALRRAKVSVAAFGIRGGMPVGLSVTLRGARMYHFLDKLFSIVLPRLRDFRGAAVAGFDKSGNYSLGLSEHTVFPEIDITKVGTPRGLEITIVVSSSTPEKSKRMLELMGLPFAKAN